MVGRGHRGGNDPRLIGPDDDEIDPEDLEDEDEEDASADTSIDDLTVDEPDPGFDKPVQVSKEDLRFGTGEAPAIPRPYQGIPRVAIVYNLNYVYDQDQDKWIKKTPTDGVPDSVRLPEDGQGSFFYAGFLADSLAAAQTFGVDETQTATDTTLTSSVGFS